VDVYAEKTTFVIQLGVAILEKSAPWFKLPCLTAYFKNQAANHKWTSEPNAETHSAFKRVETIPKALYAKPRSSSKDAFKTKFSTISSYQVNINPSTGILLEAVIQPRQNVFNTLG
jgi:hypothetical protein